MTVDRNPRSGRLAERVRELLADARLAREAGHWSELRSLTSAVLALDPANAEAEALLTALGERRQMTLMFCDVVGSTAIADACDPDEYAEILREYRDTCTEAIERFGGFIEDHQGDGMLVRFGYPEVHEDDARRAVLSGLDMVTALQERGRRLSAEYGVDLHIRVSVHTDLVVLDGGIVTGSTPNEASRLQALAKPDTVIISDATHALVCEHFDVEPMGFVDLRGVSRPVKAFTVLGEHSGGQLQVAAGLSPFSGRGREREVITGIWRDACEDWHAPRDRPSATVRALLITGGAGIGKSRLVLETTRGMGARCLECRCSGYHEATSLFPFTHLLEDACGIAEADDGDARAAKLRARLGEGADLPFLAAALRIPAASSAPPTEVDPGKLRELALGAAARLVHEHARGPAFLFVDDLHWADQSSLDLISAVLATPHPGLVVILAARAGFEPPWPESLVARLALAPLTSQELERLAGSMPEASGLSETQRAELIARSDGVPLFLEELIRTAAAVAQGRVLHRSIQQADFAIPPALRDPLLSRLAMPGVDLALAQMAATIGRDIDRSLLREVTDLGDDVFDDRLEALVGAGLLDDSGDAAVRFRHELIREVAYETQRLSARRERHSRIADHLLQGRTTARRGDAGGAAFHLERAQRHEEAIDAYVRAAQAAQALGAHTEATARLTRALGPVSRLPLGPAREQTELAVRQLRSFSAVMAGGYAAPEAAEDHPRCVELCRILGLGPELIPSLIRSWSYYAFRGNLAEADDVNTAMEQRQGGPGPDFPFAFAGRGIIEFFRGRLGEARPLMEAFVAHPWGRTEARPPDTWQLPNDPLACVAAHLVPTLWIGGDRDAADEIAALAMGRSAGLVFPYGPFSAGYVHSLLALTRRLEGDHAAAARHAGAMIELGERHGFVPWSLAGAIQAGFSGLHAGDLSGLDAVIAAVGAWRDVLVAEVWMPYWLTELAAAERAVGRIEDALFALDEALAVAARTGSDFYSAETLRIRGELRCEQRDPEGMVDLHAALEKARGQQASAFELRAAMSLARAASGSAAAHDALEAAIGRFSRAAHHTELDEARSLAAL